MVQPIDLVRWTPGWRETAAAITGDLNAANLAVHQVLLDAMRHIRDVDVAMDEPRLRAQVERHARQIRKI